MTITMHDYVTALYPDAMRPHFGQWLASFPSVAAAAQAIQSHLETGDAPQAFLDFAEKAALFEHRRETGDIPDEPEELAFQLMRHFFPETLKYAGRDDWGAAYRKAMTPNLAGVAGVMTGNPHGTDCIAFAGRFFTPKEAA